MKRVMFAICLLFINLSAVDFQTNFKSFSYGYAPEKYEKITETYHTKGFSKHFLNIGLTDSYNWGRWKMKYSLIAHSGDNLTNEVFTLADNFQRYRIFHLDEKLYPSSDKVGSFFLSQNFDRLNLVCNFTWVDVFLGRQAISWGTARIINPTDIITPISFNDVNDDERLGVDALRFRIPLGIMDELDFGFVAGKDFDADNSAYYIRYKGYKFQTDFSILAINFSENLLIGADMTRAILSAGSWIETAFVVSDKFDEQEEKKSFSLSAGLDYNFTDKIYSYFEYHYNSAGEQEAMNYLLNADKTVYQEGNVYLLNQHYLSLGMSYQLLPLVPLGGLVMLNPVDQSLMFSPSLEYNISDDVYIGAGCFLGIGENTENPLDIKSEFGLYPNNFYLNLQFYLK